MEIARYGGGELYTELLAAKPWSIEWARKCAPAGRQQHRKRVGRRAAHLSESFHAMFFVKPNGSRASVGASPKQHCAKAQFVTHRHRGMIYNMSTFMQPIPFVLKVGKARPSVLPARFRDTPPNEERLPCMVECSSGWPQGGRDTTITKVNQETCDDN